MKPDVYRREYAAYRSALEGARHDFHAGRSPELRLAPVRERYADLWTRDSIAALARARAETPAGFETERAALDVLTNIARLGYAEASELEASEELSRCESASHLDWGGGRLSAADAARLLRDEADAGRRRELAARHADALRACDDLRASRLEALNGAARSLDPEEAATARRPDAGTPPGDVNSQVNTTAATGDASVAAVGGHMTPGTRSARFGSYGALLAVAQRSDAVRPLASAEALLERTARPYDTHLRRWASRHLPPAAAREPDNADRLFFARLAHLERFFPAAEAGAAFDATMRALGLAAGRHGNLRVEEWAGTGAGGARCFGVNPPSDVRLVHAPRAGADFFRRYFTEAARAQQLSWCSRELAARRPEFVHSPDGSTGAGFGALFRQFWLDPAWLADVRGLGPVEASSVASACALVELYEARRESALLRDWGELNDSGGAASESLAQTYAARQTEATGLRHAPAHHLADVTEDGPRAAERLRGRLFAAAAAEHLRVRHGRRWWAARAAGDRLADLWNTASRYPVEELSALADFGAPDAELLCAQLTAALEGAG